MYHKQIIYNKNSLYCSFHRQIPKKLKKIQQKIAHNNLPVIPQLMKIYDSKPKIQNQSTQHLPIPGPSKFTEGIFATSHSLRTQSKQRQREKQWMMGSLRKFGSGSFLGNQEDRPIMDRLMELEGECKIVQWEFIRVNKVQMVFALFIIIVTVFGLFVLKYSAWFRKMAFFENVSQEEATHIFIKDNDKKNDIVKIINPGKEILVFFFKKLKYSISNANKRKPTPVAYQFQREFQHCFSQSRIKRGLSSQQVTKNRQLYGLNQHLVETPSFPQYLLDVMTQPFFLLQYFFCFVFFLQGYAPFSIALLFFSILTTTINYIMLYISYKKIKEIAERAIEVKVIRDGKQLTIDSKQLVPGDVYLPEENGEVAADCIIGLGDTYVNEANLTGQSIPIGKFSIQFLQQIDISNTWIYEGSKILQTKPGNTFAIVINTGFTTHRGRIIRKILNRTVKDPDMLRSTGIFVLEVVIVSMIAFFATLYLQLVRDIEKLFVFFKFIDFLASSAPPPLPIFFNLAYSLSLFRLGFKGITGTEPQKTVEGSQIFTFCFDKTGTLTRNQVRISKIFKIDTQTHKSLSFNNIIPELGHPRNLKVWQLFSTCHTTKIINNQLLGDQIDKQMFNFINAQMENSVDPNIRIIIRSTKDSSNGGNGKSKYSTENQDANGEVRTPEQMKDQRKKAQSLKSMPDEQHLQVLRINQFESKFQSMSVLVRDAKTGRHIIFAKGSPQKLMASSSNIKLASDTKAYNMMIKKLSLNGLRTIGYGYRQLPKSSPQLQKYLSCDRELFLQDLTLLGLICFENKLKHDTKETITKLTNSNIETKMITGDSLYIAMETARRAGIVASGEKVVFFEGKSCIREGINQDANTNQSGERKRIFYGTMIEINRRSVENQNGVEESREQFTQTSVQISESSQYLKGSYTLAVDNAFLMLQPAPYLSSKIKIFARIPPQNKALIIKKYKIQQNQLIKQKYSKIIRFLRTKNTKIGMCGDGANDLMALRQADLSIGIQATDASYGSSFTIKNMLDIDQIIRQSKCAQANIIQLYQFYGTIAMFVLICSIILITDTSYFSTAQLMYLNFGAVLLTPVMIALSKPSTSQSEYVPDANMMGLHNHLIFWGNLLIPYAGVLGAWFYYSNTPLYTPNSQKTVSIQSGGFNSKTQSTTLIYVLVLLTTACNGFISYRSQPWRKPIYTNFILSFLIVINLSLAIIFAFFNDHISEVFQFQFIDRWNIGICILIMIGTLIASLVYHSAVGLFRLEYRKLKSQISGDGGEN